VEKVQKCKSFEPAGCDHVVPGAFIVVWGDHDVVILELEQRCNEDGQPDDNSSAARKWKEHKDESLIMYNNALGAYYSIEPNITYTFLVQVKILVGGLMCCMLETTRKKLTAKTTVNKLTKKMRAIGLLSSMMIMKMIGHVVCVRQTEQQLNCVKVKLWN